MPEIKTYSQDERKSIKELYDSFHRLDSEFWTYKTILQQKFMMKKRQRSAPILAFRTKKKGPALWIISGIHGEEPAGPNAITDNIGFLNDLAQKIPIVLLPLCNPAGYIRNWRYPNRKKRARDLHELPESIETSEYFLPSEKNPKKPRVQNPTSKEAEEFTLEILKLTKRYRPKLVLDFHEDESVSSFYIYSHGKLGSKDPIAREIVKKLVREGFNIQMWGETRFGEKIVEGIVSDARDSSIDDLLAAKKVIIDKKIQNGPHAKSVIVVETTTKNIPLKKRVDVHSEIILLSKRYFEMAKQMK